MAKPKATTTAETETETTELVTDEATIAKLTAAARTQGLEEGKTIGVQAGILAERERVLGIDKIALPGHEALIAQCKAEGASLEDTKTKILEAEKVARTRHLEAIKTDGKQAVPANPTATGEPTTTDDSVLPFDERVKAQWDKDAKLRSEYLENFDAYRAFERANAKGLVRVKSTAIN